MTKTILKILAVVAISLAIAWIAFLNGIQFFNHQWIYSSDNAVKASQYLFHAVWGIFSVTCPAWWLFGTSVAIKHFFGIKDEKK